MDDFFRYFYGICFCERCKDSYVGNILFGFCEVVNEVFDFKFKLEDFVY